tara:strand:- start:4431 stop:4682 length:252 start_codon:yes stop_codon:yes gene_type:complete
MIRTITITTQDELEETWGDSRCPNMCWHFIERTLEECMQDDDTCSATYETFEVPVGETFRSTYLTSSGDVTYTLQAGEYGVKP